MSRLRRVDQMTFYEILSTIERDVWDDAARVVAGGDALSAGRRATRGAFRAARLGDYFTARSLFRTAKAIEFLSNPKPPKYMPLH